MKKFTLFLFTALMLVNVINATVFYVVPGGSGSKDGNSWENAANLTTATLAQGQAGDEFWVKAGVYQSAIQYSNRVLYGGFDGTETTLESRDWVKNKTIIQGIDNATVPLVLMQASTVSNILDGFIIQDNHIETSSQNGGGINVNNNGLVRNCIVRNNSSISTANVGGGIFVGTSTVTPIIENCLIINNSAANNGGGIQVVNAGKLKLVNSTVANNKITKETSVAGSGFGCGVGLPPTAVLTAENCIVYNNQKPDGTGALTFSFGANYNTNNNTGSTVRNCAYDAINAGTGTQNGVVFATKTNCIDDLSAIKTPGFTLPTDFYGAVATTNTTDYAKFASADYRLTLNSVCKDEGDNTVATGIAKDLAGNVRIYNTVIDLGAYEYTPEVATGIDGNFAALGLYMGNDFLRISGLNTGDNISIYNTLGKIVFSSKSKSNTINIPFTLKGIYIIKLNDKSQKIIF